MFINSVLIYFHFCQYNNLTNMHRDSIPNLAGAMSVPLNPRAYLHIWLQQIKSLKADSNKKGLKG
jgi:hypothetical protein